MRPYVDALYDPTPSRYVEKPDRRREEDPFELFQLASAGDFDILLAIRSDPPWEVEGSTDLGEVSLPASALVDYVTGEGPTQGLEDVAGDNGETTAAAIVAAVQLADAGQGAEACDVLRDALARSGALPTGDRCALSVHLGLRCAELGLWDEALEVATSAVEMCAEADFEHSDLVAERVLHHVATQNLFAFEQAGRGVIRLSTGGPRRTFPDQVLASVADGVDAWMDKDFEAAFADPHRRQFTISSGDRSERSFLAAVVRSELIGSWRWRRLARRALGRYSLRRVVGQPRGEVASGIATLIEAEDAKGLALATRHFCRYGPLGGVARVAASLVAERPWGPTRVAASIAVLREAVELLTEESAHHLAQRLTSEFDLLRRPTLLADLTAELLSLLAQLARHWRAPDVQTTIADVLLTRLQASPDALLQQRAVIVIDAIDWTAVPEDTLGNWEAHALVHLEGDAGFPSRAFLEAAVVVGEPARDALRDAFRRSGDHRLAIVLLRVGDLDPDASARLVEDAAAWVGERAAEARRGVFGMYAYDNALVLAVAARQGLEQAWPPLIEFLRNPNVLQSQKEASLRYLRDHVGDLPSSWREEIVSAGSDLSSGASVPMDIGVTSVHAASLRLAAGGLSPDEARAEVIRAATSGDDSERAAAVQMLVDAREIVGSEATIMTLLLLSRDRHPAVRGKAGRLLSRVAHPSDPDLGARARLLEMLREPGTFVPSAVLFGIYEERLRFGDLVEPCTALSNEHLSVEVRELARAVAELQSTPQPPKGSPST